MKKFILIIVSIILTSLLSAEIPRVFVAIMQKDIKSGDKVEILIGAEAKKGSKFKLPRVDKISGYKVLSKKGLVTYRVLEQDGKKQPLVKRALNYTIKPDKSFDMESFTIKINQKEYKTVPFRVKVLSKAQKRDDNKSKNTKKEVKAKGSSKKNSTKTEAKTKTNESAKKNSKKRETKTKESNKKNSIKTEAKTKERNKKEIKKVNKPTVAIDTLKIEDKNTIGTTDVPKINNFIFKMSSSKKDLVVGESFIVKVELIEPINISSQDLQYFAPKFEGFKFQPIGDGKIEENSNSVIRTIEYLVTPLKYGKLTIQPARAKVGIQLAPQGQSPFGFFGSDIEWIKLKTNSLSFSVKKIAINVDLVGKFKIETAIDSKMVKANKPFDYTLIITGLGDLDDYSAPRINIDNVTTFNKDAKIKHIMTNRVVVTKYSKKYTFISDHDFIIPSIKIKVYNPETKKIYYLKSKELNVKIKKVNSITSALHTTKGKKIDKADSKIAKNQTTVSALEQKEDTSKDKELKNVEELLLDKNYYKHKYSSGYPLGAIWGALLLGALLGIGAAVLLPGFLRIRKKGVLKNRLYSNYEEALNILYPHTTKSKSVEDMVTKLYEVTNGNREVKIDDFALNNMIKKIKE